MYGISVISDDRFNALGDVSVDAAPPVAFNICTGNLRLAMRTSFEFDLYVGDVGGDTFKTA